MEYITSYPPSSSQKLQIQKMASKDPDVLKGMADDQTAEELVVPHGVINPNEAAILVHSLDEALILMEAQIMGRRGKGHNE